MSNVLNPDQTESKPLNTELETPTLETAAEQEAPSIETTPNPEAIEAQPAEAQAPVEAAEEAAQPEAAEATAEAVAEAQPEEAQATTDVVAEAQPEEAQAEAVKEVIAWQLAEAMKKQKISKARMARLLKTSRTQVDRLLDPKNDVTLSSLQRAAALVGRRVRVELV